MLSPKHIVRIISIFAIVAMIFAYQAQAATPGTVVAWGDNTFGQTTIPPD